VDREDQSFNEQPGELSPRARYALEALSAGREVPDEIFDRLFPAWARSLSAKHWTPLTVARRAAELLVTQPGARVLDVGSGVGKFCLVGALTTEGTFIGVEQRLRFVQVARELVHQAQVPQCAFLHANVLELDWQDFDGIYLFNPFAENLPHQAPIDHTVGLSTELYEQYVHFMEEKLAQAPVGTRVATYHGFGGTLPAGWKSHGREMKAGGPLELWIKRKPRRG
jgi:SAM-dependent methyltransferase